MSKAISLLFIPLFMCPLASAEIFKCPRDNGNTIYQNFPCNIDSIGSTATAAPPPQVPEALPVASAPPRRTRAGKARDAEPVVQGMEPQIGMTIKQMKASSWGEPFDIVKEEVVEGNIQRWVYTSKRIVHFDTRGRVVEITR